MSISAEPGLGRACVQQEPRPSIISHNIAGGTLVICELLKRFKPIVLLLQEVTISSKELNKLVNRLNYVGETNIDPEFPNQRGTAIVWRKCQQVVNPPRVVVPRRLQVLTLGRGGQGRGLTIVNIYCPTGSAGKEEREALISGPLTTTLRGLGAGANFIVCGDWNSVVSEIDVQKNFPNKKSESTARLVQYLGLQDVFRHFSPQALVFTFYRASVSTVNDSDLDSLRSGQAQFPIWTSLKNRHFRVLKMHVFVRQFLTTSTEYPTLRKRRNQGCNL